MTVTVVLDSEKIGAARSACRWVSSCCWAFRRDRCVRRVERAEIRDHHVRLRLDRRQRGPRESARYELAVEEQRIGRAVDEVSAVRLFVEHHP